jgi:hypothetical protein
VGLCQLLVMGVALRGGNDIAQHKSLKEQLVGTWTLVSSHNVRSDGSRVVRRHNAGEKTK